MKDMNDQWIIIEQSVLYLWDINCSKVQAQL